MIITLASINNKTTKVKRLRVDRFCVFFFCLGFVLWRVLFFHTYVKLRKFSISKNLVIIFKLSTI